MTKFDKHRINEQNICTAKLKKKSNKKKTIKLILYKIELISNNYNFYE